VDKTLTSQERQELLGPDWAKALASENELQHDFMSNNFRDKMEVSLKAFAGPTTMGRNFLMIWYGVD